jgi:SAM-dependent methyltransferase
MTPQIMAWVKHTKEKYIKHPGMVLEIGALDVNGNVREFFTDATKYIGIDIQHGKNVDVVLNAHDLLKVFSPSQFDTVLCLEMLEHDDNPLLTVQNIHSVLKPGGFFIVSTPTIGFPYHPYPKDYWRFTVDTYTDIFFKDMEILEIRELKDPVGNPGLIGLGKKLF